MLENPNAIEATIEEEFFFHDGLPNLVTLRSGSSFFVAVVSWIDAPEYYGFLAAEVTEDEWKQYMNAERDLRSLFVAPASEKWFSFSYKDTKEARLVPFMGQLPEECLPKSGVYHHRR